MPENIFKLGKKAKPPGSFGLLKEEQRPVAPLLPLTLVLHLKP